MADAFTTVAMLIVGFPFLIALAILILASLKIVNQYERGVRFTLGRYSGIMEPGLRVIIPVIQSWVRIDIRTAVIDVPKQDTMTADNVSVQINAVVYFKVSDPKKAVLEVMHYEYAISQMAQTTMRDVVGEISLDELLSKRESVAKRIRDIIDKSSDPWGIKAEMVEIKDIELPDSLIRVIAKEAEAEREKRAVIIKAQGELEAAKNLVSAAKVLTQSKGGMHIRTLQTINQLGSERSNTDVWATPAELIRKLSNMKI